MSAQNPLPTKVVTKIPAKNLLSDNLKSITLKGSTEDSSSNLESIVALEDQNLSSNDQSQQSDSQQNHRFNLRDRKKIALDKKDEVFVFYKQDDDIHSLSGEEE